MGISEIIALMQKMIENMESHHKLILGICICIIACITILGKAYISSTTELKREQMLLNASQSRYQQTVVRKYVVSNQQPIIKNSDVNSNDVTVEITSLFSSLSSIFLIFLQVIVGKILDIKGSYYLEILCVLFGVIYIICIVLILKWLRENRNKI